MRLRTLPLTVACISLAGLLAKSRGAFSLEVYIWALVTALLLQILSNLANDYGDAVHGADHEGREGPQREVQKGSITAKAMKNAIVISAVLSLISGLFLLFSADLDRTSFIAFIALGLFSIVAAVLYTNGTRPYGYIGLGDLSVFVFFGIVGVFASYYLISSEFYPAVLLPASASGLLAVAVLNINNIRDIESDRMAGKMSIPVRLGRPAAIKYHQILLLLAVGLFLYYAIIHYKQLTQLAFLLLTPLLIRNAIMVSRSVDAKVLDAALRQMALSALVFILGFGLSLL